MTSGLRMGMEGIGMGRLMSPGFGLRAAWLCAAAWRATNVGILFCLRNEKEYR